MAPDGTTAVIPDYPVNMILTGRRCLVVGGGNVAERKVFALLESGAIVTVISPTVTSNLAEWALQERLTHLPKTFEKGDVDGYLLVMCATDSPAVNRQAAEEAKQSGALANVADAPELCDFTLPARLRQGSLMISVSTGGQSPALARELRNELAETYGVEYAYYLEMAGRLRREWQASCASSEERCQRWKEVKGFDPEVLDLLRQGRMEEAEVRFKDDIGSSGT